MLLRNLKKIRVAVSLAFFVFTALLFLDFRNLIPVRLHSLVLYVQFTPSVLKFFSLAGLASLGFVIVLVLTLLFGRVYCSTICPLGTLQDIVSFISRSLRPQRYYEPHLRHTGIHLAFLMAAVVPLSVGSVFGVILLDPFSNFGRISGTLIRPLMVVGNNGISAILEHFRYYDVYRVGVTGATPVSVVLALLLLALIVWMSFQHGRLYCNSICPVGSLLRIASRLAVFRITIDPSRCKSCQLCQRVCKAGCIDRKSKTVDFERCVDCFNCIPACPSSGVTVRPLFRRRRASASDVDADRRALLFGTPLLFLGQQQQNSATTAKPQQESTVPEYKHHAVSPPGSRSIRAFNELCTACQICVSACPSHVLQPSVTHYGFGGILQPTMDFNTSYCNFECTACTEVCPSGALRKLTVEEKKVNQAGRVVFVRQNCVVYTENTDCGACTEHCPTKAVVMIPYKNSRIPEVSPEYCIGCGACEHACPTRPYRAIYVDGNAIHLVARKKETLQKQLLNPQSDFPF